MDDAARLSQRDDGPKVDPRETSENSLYQQEFKTVRKGTWMVVSVALDSLERKRGMGDVARPAEGLTASKFDAFIAFK